MNSRDEQTVQSETAVSYEETKEQLEDIENELESLQDRLVTLPNRTADEVEDRFNQY